MHRFYLFVFSFLLFHFLFAGHVAAANNSTIAGVYQQTNPNASWRFTESDALGNRFIYKKDKQVVTLIVARFGFCGSGTVKSLLEFPVIGTVPSRSQPFPKSR